MAVGVSNPRLSWGTLTGPGVAEGAGMTECGGPLGAGNGAWSGVAGVRAGLTGMPAGTELPPGEGTGGVTRGCGWLAIGTGALSGVAGVRAGLTGMRAGAKFPTGAGTSGTG